MIFIMLRKYVFENDSIGQIQDEAGNGILGNINEADLQKGWEKRKDKFGRIYYMDHIAKTSQWEDPTDGLKNQIGISDKAQNPERKKISSQVTDFQSESWISIHAYELLTILIILTVFVIIIILTIIAITD